MTQHREPDSADAPYRYLHLSLEELAQLPPDELLRASLEMRRLLDIIMGVLYHPDSTPVLHAVAIDLLYSEAERLSQQEASRRRDAGHAEHQDRERPARHSTGCGAAGLRAVGGARWSADRGTSVARRSQAAAVVPWRPLSTVPKSQESHLLVSMRL